MKEDSRVVAITSGTPAVMGFTEDKRKEAGRQFIDVGIAEETAVALASGIAANGGKPVYGVYSTFVQRTFDQIAQDLLSLIHIFICDICAKIVCRSQFIFTDCNSVFYSCRKYYE